MAKAIVSNWVTSAVGIMALGVQFYASLTTGAALNPEMVLCAIGLLGAKDGS